MPIVYAAPHKRGGGAASLLHHLDVPIMTASGPWLPGGEHEQSEYSLRAALKISSNRAAAQLLQQVGYSQATYYAQRMGTESRLPAVASLAPGTGGVPPPHRAPPHPACARRGGSTEHHRLRPAHD